MSLMLFTQATIGVLICLSTIALQASASGQEGKSGESSSHYTGYETSYPYQEYMETYRPNVFRSIYGANFEPRPLDRNWEAKEYGTYATNYDTSCNGQKYENLVLNPQVNCEEKRRQRQESRHAKLQSGAYDGDEGKWFIAEHNDNVLTRAMRHVSLDQNQELNGGFLYLPVHQRVYFHPGTKHDAVKRRWQDHLNGRPMASLEQDHYGIWHFNQTA